jgi:hypothetical protein
MAKIVKSITIDEETYKEIEMLCTILNRNFSNYVESLLKEEVKKLKEVK